MFNDSPFDAATNCVALDSTASLKIGDRVLVLFGDTPILGTIDSAHGLMDAEGMAWNIRTNASGRTYPIHEGFLRRTSLAAD